MFLSRTYATRGELPKGAEKLYNKQGTLFILRGATRDFVADNPWEPELWNLTAQGQFLAQHGEEMASAFAAMAGTTLGALKPSASRKPDLQVIVQRRNFSTDGSQGSSGDGPPT